jgi:4-amino-4-deoxy-L-arabinose transferase-like glycosyltransferase
MARSTTSRKPWYTNPWLQAAFVVLVAAAFRLWQIDSLPPGLFGDEATDGLDALDVLAGRGAVFFPANFGREGLHMWIVAGMFRLLGVVPLAIRLPSVVAGVLTVLATYWLGRELVTAYLRDRPATGTHETLLGWVPLLSALYLATSYWHVHFSRFGIRGVFTPLCGALAFAAFWRAVNCGDAHPPRRSYAWFALSGFFLGLATHFYTASRFFPLFVGGFLTVQLVVAYATRQRARALLHRHLWGIVLLFAVAALVFAPLGLYFIQHPGSFAQRASAVTAFSSESPWARMAQAAVANVAQFVVPGAGDPEQFYNLPGRAVFEPLTALLALIGIVLVLWRWRQAAALFLLLWFPALLVPSFLATDRWPTLPRVLGVIPGVYFFPAIGLAGAAALVVRLAQGRQPPAENQDRFTPLARNLASLVIAAALLLHAAGTYRDYFRTWGPSQATFDAFEGDMTAAWQWLRDHPAVGHVYLSSDMFRHPTFMLLHEQATVQTYFQHSNPNLSWFDGRQALPLPPAGQPATYLVGASAPLGNLAQVPGLQLRDQILAPDGSPALTVFELPAGTAAQPPITAGQSPITITAQLSLVDAARSTGTGGAPQLRLTWRTAGPDGAAWPGYHLELAGSDASGAPWQATVPFDAFRPSEWVTDGQFITWHPLPDTSTKVDRLRLLELANNTPLTTPTAPDGWHTMPSS